MGIINHDEYTLPWTGQLIQDTYFRISENQIQVKKIVPTEYDECREIMYEVSCGFELYASKDACSEKRPTIGGDYISCRVSHDIIANTPIYTLVYNKLKEKYTNYTDDK